jgi:hypothetical protein
MEIISIDPGCEQSAYCYFDDGGKPATFAKVTNDQLLLGLLRWTGDICVCERIRGMGMAVGKEVFETAEWCGRFQQAWLSSGLRHEWHWITRQDVKLHLCGSARAKDANIRQVLLDRFGGAKVAVGSKKAPGPLYKAGVDERSAIAVGLTWLDLHERECLAKTEVDFGQEIDVEIDGKEVALAFEEAWGNVTNNEWETLPTRDDIIRAIGKVGIFLRALTDKQIADLNVKQRETVRKFLESEVIRW